MCDENVTNVLQLSVENSKGTKTFLQIMRDVIGAYMEKDLSPLERIKKTWYSPFIIRNLEKLHII